ncbi:MAG: M15 family metallopeptidase [Clostridia bacterium]|nr:M15 family metallopeptidase [Clostridia bacterium]
MFSDNARGFVSIGEAIPDVILEIRYYSTFNFVGERIDGYEQPVALLTGEAVSALKKASDQAVSRGYRLKIFDAYRPQKAVDHFMRWAEDLSDVRMKPYFYPGIDKSALIPGGYIMAHSSHSRGSAVDLTLFDMRTQRESDMGSPFDFFGEESHPDYRGITEEQYGNRMLLREIMLSCGFLPLNEEWWHFSLAGEPWPDTAFTFPVRC